MSVEYVRRTFVLTPTGPEWSTGQWHGFSDLINLSPLELRIQFELYKAECDAAQARRRKAHADWRESQDAKQMDNDERQAIENRFKLENAKAEAQYNRFELRHIWLLYKDFKRLGKRREAVPSDCDVMCCMYLIV